jgi:hypothetical protein
LWHLALEGLVLNLQVRRVVKVKAKLVDFEALLRF